MVHENSLAAKVAATNNAHAYALKLFPVLAEFFTAYVGQKIFKADGTLLKRIIDAMPAFPETGVPGYRLSVYRHSSDYSLAWTVKACESSPGRHPGDQIANYYEVVVYVGVMVNGFLEKLNNPIPYRDNYTSVEVLNKIDALKKAEQAVSDARSALWPFKESDTWN